MEKILGRIKPCFILSRQMIWRDLGSWWVSGEVITFARKDADPSNIYLAPNVPRY